MRSLVLVVALLAVAPCFATDDASPSLFSARSIKCRFCPGVAAQWKLSSLFKPT